MLVTERPGIFYARSYNEDSWYVVDTAYAKFEKDVIAEWRQQNKSTNRPRWVVPLVRYGAVIVALGLMLLAAVLLRGNEVGLALILIVMLVGLLWLIVMKLVERRWPPAPAAGSHIHAVVAIDGGVASAASDSTSWYALWEVSVELLRLQQVNGLCAQLDANLEVVHDPEERAILTTAREALEERREYHHSAFDEIAEASRLFISRKYRGIVY